MYLTILLVVEDLNVIYYMHLKKLVAGQMDRKLRGRDVWTSECWQFVVELVYLFEFLVRIGTN